MRITCIIVLALVSASPRTFAQPTDRSGGTSPTIKASWTPTGNLNLARENQTITPLADGRVMLIGGQTTTVVTTFTGGAWYADPTPRNSVEIYERDAGTWRSTGSLNLARYRTTATLLPTGQVLVGGGYASSETRSAELYDPATEEWRPTGNLMTARADHAAVLLQNGRVLVVGGSLRSAELYDPVTQTWSSTGSTTVVSFSQTATLLPDGKVLAIGNKDCIKVAELYDPATGQWSPTPSPPVYGCAERATLIASGQVLVTDGARAQLYDPVTGQWSATTGPRLVGSRHTLTLLPNGQVLAAGGQIEDFAVDGAELYDPATGNWAATTALPRPHATHSAALLPNGKVLVAAGFDGSCCDWRYTLYSADLFDMVSPQSGTLTNLSAASYRAMGIASESIVAAFGSGLASTTARATSLSPPAELGGTTVKVKDSAGSERAARIFYISPAQVTYQIPPETTAGAATITITSGDGTISTGVSVIRDVAPSLFTANSDGKGVAAAVVRRLRADGFSLDEPIAAFVAEEDRFVPLPIDLGSATDRVLLILSGTGIRFRNSLSTVIATIGGAYAEVISAEAKPESIGIDQVEVLVPRSLAGRGEVDVLLTVDGQIANPVRISIK